MAKRSLKLADPLSLKEAEARCKELVSDAVANRKISECVEMLLLESSGQLPRQEQVATSLNISTRTLDRYLRKEDTSFRELFKQAQYKKACKLLANTNLSITQIALELGYTDAS